MEPKKHRKGEFKYTILPEQDNDLKIRIKNYPTIRTYTNDDYYYTYVGMMIYNRMKKKLQVIYFNL